MTRDSFVWYESFSKAINILPEADQLYAYKYIIDYGLYGIEPEEKNNSLAYAIFVMAKPQINANNKKYENGKKGGEYGTLGGRPKKDWENSQKPLRGKKISQTETPNVNVNDNVNENVNENVNVNVNVNANDNVNEKIKTKKINKKIIYSEDFESFWKAYPKKKGKQKARESWENTIKGGYDPKLLITKAGEYATEIKLKRVEDKFIKMAQGWLNDGRFDDDYFTGNNNEKPDLDVIY